MPEWEHKILLSVEREALGFYITGHPLLRFSDRLKLVTNANSGNLNAKHDKDNVIIAGIVSGISEKKTKRNDIMCYITLEDLQGSINTIFFSVCTKNTIRFYMKKEPIVIKGTLDISGVEETPKLTVIAQEVTSLTQSLENPYKQVRFMVDTNEVSTENIASLISSIKKFHGKCEGYVHILNGKSETVIYLGDEFRLDINDKLKREADNILGEGATIYSV